ncbi:tetratricopeptide repeat-containing sensor histidine kinase [Pseudotenacibaculum haliotis]|uniref:histidine kinase n=1 Tax=Pseudotenacibaculum haliotis TaxID=1862138 RepID=A0ABW5LXF9_9FLAO
MIVVFQAAFVFSQSEDTKAAIYKSLNKSLELTDNRKLDSAQFYLDKAIALFPEKIQDSTLYFRKQVAEGAISMRKGNNEEALQFFLSSLAFFKKQKDAKNIGLTLYQIGICNYFLNRRSKAEDFFLEANSYRDFLPKRIQTKLLQNLGTINLEEGMAQERSELLYKAIDNYTKASQIYKEEGWITDLSLCTSLLAECYIQLNKLDDALSTIDLAIDYGKQANSNNYIGFALIKKSSIYQKKKDLRSSLTVINEAIDIYQKTEDKNTLLYAYNEKKRTLDSLKMYKASASLADSIWSLTVTIYNQRIADGVTEMEAKYKMAEKEKEIAQQKLHIKNKNIFALILGGSIIILGIIIVGLYKRHQFKQKQFRKEMELKDALSQIKTQNRLQEQRLEISRDLHDNIGSQLTFIISSLDNLKRLSSNTNDIVKEKLTSISGFTAETIGQLRDTIWAMNKNEISFEELYARLLSYVEKAKEVTHSSQFAIEEDVSSELKFSSVVGMNLFRVIQESINNAIKHAEASKIDISFKEDAKTLFVSIKDDGVGFDKTSFSAGNGLSNIESRISDIKGEVFIESEPKKGTSILINIDKSHL